jgi:hypothetical protein
MYTRPSDWFSGVKICRNAEIVIKGCMWAFPDAEELDLAADLFAPLAVVVWGRGK